jgi:hypothetical protein
MRAMQKRSISLHEFHVKRHQAAAMVVPNNQQRRHDDQSQ